MVFGERVTATARLEDRIATQRGRVVAVFVAERDPVDALPEQLGQRVLDVPRAWIGQRSRQGIHEAKPSVHLAQQERTAVRRDRRSIEDGAHLARTGERGSTCTAAMRPETS